MSNTISPARPLGFSELLAAHAQRIRERDQREDPELARRIEAADLRTSQEITIPTSTGYELKPGAGK